MTKLLLALAATVLSASLAAQVKKPAGAEPATLVSRAEELLKHERVDEAVLVLWQALDGLATHPGDATSGAIAAAARSLLERGDPHEAQRRAVFTSVAKQQVELAAAYRGRKWFDTAVTLLDVADRHDAEVAVKERAALDAAKASAKEARAKKATLSPLLHKKNARNVFGMWREAGESLESPPHAKDEPMHEWITASTHGDNQVVLEFKPSAADQPTCAGLWVGYVGVGVMGAGFHITAHYTPEAKEYCLGISELRGGSWTDHGSTWLAGTPSPDGFHRLDVQVSGQRLRARLDGGAPVEHAAQIAIRGHVGLTVGIRVTGSCSVLFRNLRIDPLPLERPSDDKALNPEAAGSDAIDEAKGLLAKKQPEAASRVLRGALSGLAGMPAGEPRAKLQKAIDQVLAQADPLAPRREKTEHAIASELVTLADAYTKAGLLRAALKVVERAATFDPEGQAVRLAAAREAVRQ